jgi:hypothetical protein
MRAGWRGASLRLRTLVLALMASGASQSPQPAVAAVTADEQAAWDRARSAGTADAFQRYLEEYPTGQYAEEAFRTIIEQSWSGGLREAPEAGSPRSAGAAASLSEYERAQLLSAARGLY